MHKFTIPSKFGSIPTEIFLYLARKKSEKFVFILKGLYGYHDPASESSWENVLISEMNDEFNFVCINSSRENNLENGKGDPSAFFGKKFKQECDDIKDAFDFLGKSYIKKSSGIIIIGNSFGGTVLLGVPFLLQSAQSIILINSGCGKSLETKKPLLATLPEENILLDTLDLFRGVFAYIQSGNDNLVPKESQQKIITHAKNASLHLVLYVPFAQHDLVGLHDRSRIISSTLKYVASFGTSY